MLVFMAIYMASFGFVTRHSFLNKITKLFLLGGLPKILRGGVVKLSWSGQVCD